MRSPLRTPIAQLPSPKGSEQRRRRSQQCIPSLRCARTRSPMGKDTDRAREGDGGGDGGQALRSRPPLARVAFAGLPARLSSHISPVHPRESNLCAEGEKDRSEGSEGYTFARVCCGAKKACGDPDERDESEGRERERGASNVTAREGGRKSLSVLVTTTEWCLV